MSNEKRDMGLPEAAQRLGVSWHRAWRLALTGALRATRDPASGKWRISRASVDEFLRQRASQSDAD